MFLSRNKKNNAYPCKPQFYYIKVGFKHERESESLFLTIDVCARLVVFSFSSSDRHSALFYVSLPYCDFLKHYIVHNLNLFSGKKEKCNFEGIQRVKPFLP